MAEMKDWLIFRGANCTSFGLHVLEYPPTTVAAERLTFTNVPGRSGALTQREGKDVYEDITLPFKMYVKDPEAHLDEIGAYLSGMGTLEYPYRPGRHYKGAQVVNQIPLNKILRERPNRSFTVNFRMKPFAYVNNVSDVTVTESLTDVHNDYSVHSEPVITVYGHGDITLMVGSQIVELTGVDGYITINSDLRECYDNNGLANDRMTGDFPVLDPGQNAIQWNGNVTKVVVSPNWRSK